ncbi:MAG: hypothetical protein AB7N99_08695 [Simkaniaceae bacterium]
MSMPVKTEGNQTQGSSTEGVTRMPTLFPSTVAVLHVLENEFTNIAVLENEGRAQLTKEMQQTGQKEAERDFWKGVDTAIAGGIGGLGGVVGGIGSLGMISSDESLDSQINGLKEQNKTIESYQNELKAPTGVDVSDHVTIDGEEITPDDRITQLKDPKLDANSLDFAQDVNVLKTAKENGEADVITENLDKIKANNEEQIKALQGQKDRHVDGKASAFSSASRGAGEILKAIPEGFAAHSGAQVQLQQQTNQMLQQTERSLQEDNSNNASTVTKLQELENQVVAAASRT